MSDDKAIPRIASSKSSDQKTKTLKRKINKSWSPSPIFFTVFLERFNQHQEITLVNRKYLTFEFHIYLITSNVNPGSISTGFPFKDFTSFKKIIQFLPFECTNFQSLKNHNILIKTINALTD